MSTGEQRERRSDNRSGVYYADYLKVDTLLASIQPESAKFGEPAHEEHLFIVIHQVYELWFKQILHELTSVIDIFVRDFVDERQLLVVVNRIQRIIEIQKLLIQQMRVIETMDSADFMEFRNYLVPASGFQSLQFRKIEVLLGLQMEKRSRYQQNVFKAYLSEKDIADLEKTEKSPTLFAAVQGWLERVPTLQMGDYSFWAEFDKAAHQMIDDRRNEINSDDKLTEADKASLLEACTKNIEAFEQILSESSYEELRTEGHRRLSYKAIQGALMIHLYRQEPLFHLPYQILMLITEVDLNFVKWRHEHLSMVQRIIGAKVGTGGSSGYQYLRSTITDHYKVFLDLFYLPTYILPRTHIPKLPQNISRQLDFTISNKP